MKTARTMLVYGALTGLAVLAAGCSFSVSTANLSSLKTSSDKAGKAETSSFHAGDTLYGKAQVSNNGGKVTVNLYLVAEDVKGIGKGDTLKGSEVSVGIEGDRSANYNVTVSDGMPKGTYSLHADMLNEAGEKKDSKSVAVKVTDE